jgi:hypothetical protein
MRTWLMDMMLMSIIGFVLAPALVHSERWWGRVWWGSLIVLNLYTIGCGKCW